MNYFNSTIERKRGTCLDCGIDAFVTAGRCDTHYPIHRKKMMLEKQKIKQKVLSLKNTPANISLAVINNKVENTDLQLFYKLRRNEMKGKCSEPGCKQSTNVYDDRYFKWSIAHICPKSLIKSVATNQNNWLELCQEHHRMFDSNFEAASRMECFKEAKIKFELFRYLIPNHEIRKINPYLL